MQRRGGARHAVALALILLLAPTLAQPARAQGREVLLNLHVAESRGCAGMFGHTAFDAHVYVDGILQRTLSSADYLHGDFYEVVRLSAGPLTRQVSIEIVGSGHSLFMAWSEVCDASPDAGRWLNVTIPDSGGRAFTGTGESSFSVALGGYVSVGGATPPEALALRADRVGTDSVDLSWTAGAAQEQIVAVNYGRYEVAPAGASALAVDGLLDDVEHRFRLVRNDGGWKVGGPALRVRTENAPPPAPAVELRQQGESLVVEWFAHAHDLARIEVHASPEPDFEVRDGTLAHAREVDWSSGWHGEHALPRAPGEPMHVRVVTQDAAGARTASAAVAAPAPEPEPQPAEAEPPRQAEPVDVRAVVHRRHVALSWPGAPLVPDSVRQDVLLAPRDDADAPWTAAASVTPASVEATLRNLTANAAYRVRVVSVDADGLGVETARGSFTFVHDNAPPEAHLRLAPAEARAGREVAAHVMLYDPDGDPLEATIDWGDGTRERARAQATHAYAAAGTYRVLLEARDPDDAAATATAAVHVAPNAAPTARLLVENATWRVGDAVPIRVEASDPDGDPVTTSVDWGDGVRETVHGEASHVYASAGTWNVRVRVQDADGLATLRETAVVVVETLPPNRPPVALLVAPPATHAGEEVRVAVGGSLDPEGAPLETWIDWGDGNVTREPYHAYDSPGPRTITLRVRDAGGAEDVHRVTIDVRDAVEATKAPQQAAPSEPPGAKAEPADPSAPLRWPLLLAAAGAAAVAVGVGAFLRRSYSKR